MKYSVVIQKLADAHFKKLKKYGDKVSLRRIKQILDELETNPTTGIGNPKQLKHSLAGFWSRRINSKDRLIYEIIEKPDKLVVVVSALGHYEDK
jgi:toxin YoeB